MYTLNYEGIQTLNYAIMKGIIDEGEETPETISKILMGQDIVSFCNENGCVSFDYTDVIFQE